MKYIFVLLYMLGLSVSGKCQHCPAINLSANSFSLTAGEPLTIKAEVKEGTNITYNWSVSTGTIMSGQGTSAITIKTDGLGGMYLTATLEIGGVPANCPSVSSTSVEILEGPEMISMITYTNSSALTAAITKFTEQTGLKNPDARFTAFIYVYAGTGTSAAQLKQVKDAVRNAFEKNGVFEYQYKIADGGKKKGATVELYKLPEGAKEPAPSR